MLQEIPIIMIDRNTDAVYNFSGILAQIFRKTNFAVPCKVS